MHERFARHIRNTPDCDLGVNIRVFTSDFLTV